MALHADDRLGSTAPQDAGAEQAPPWAQRALAAPVEHGRARVAGATLAWSAWGPADAPAVVLVHGGAAHRRWWAPLAPLLSDGRRIVAFDLSGHGDSSRRTSYDVDTWCEEVRWFAVEAVPEPAVVVGHSLGGILLAYLASRHGHELAGAVYVDAPVFDGAAAPEENLARRIGRRRRPYATRAEALSRFRLVPPQDCRATWYERYVGWHSLRQVEYGWDWKYDPEVFRPADGHDRIARFTGDVRAADCPGLLVMGARSYLVAAGTPAGFPLGSTGARGDVPLTVVEGAAHHVMLDRPRRLADVLGDALDAWPR